MNKIMRIVEKFVPGHITDPGLLIRMIKSKDSAAWFTILIAAAGLILAPLDLILQKFEKKYRTSKSKSTLPIIIVCGAPRTGTTLVSQTLIKYLPVSYFNNLTAIFPRSPITIARLIGRRLPRNINFQSYYGKTQSLSGPNDAFFLWNEWMEEDESGVRCVLREDKVEAMQQFFGTYETAINKPLLLKNNSLNTRAEAIANAMPNVYFICLTRAPEYLAQSLLKAREDIQGDITRSIWVDNPDKSEVDRQNYIEDVCDQVLYHEKEIAHQQMVIGAERYWIISYEEFCRDPKKLIMDIGRKIINLPDDYLDTLEISPFKISNNIRIEGNTFEEIRSTILRLRSKPGNSHCEIGIVVP